jgi:hypothetical protein
MNTTYQIFTSKQLGGVVVQWVMDNGVGTRALRRTDGRCSIYLRNVRTGEWMARRGGRPAAVVFAEMAKQANAA